MPNQNDNNNILSLILPERGCVFGHINIQGICGKSMTKFSELKLLLSTPLNSTLHVFGISETKLEKHKMANAFQIEGYQTRFRKGNTTNNGGVFYVKKGINVKRRVDLETNAISCIWLEIIQEKDESFLIGNLYRPPDSRTE